MSLQARMNYWKQMKNKSLSPLKQRVTSTRPTADVTK
jgi:hypothetical protein